MAFPIIPKRRSGAAGNPTSLQLGELAVNTLNGELYLGADAGVTLLNGPVTAGTTVTEHIGDGSTTAFVFSGYNGTSDGGYLVSVGGIDQPPSKYSISATAGGTITFVAAPVAGELISIRAIVAGSGGGGDGNATQIQGRDVASTAPTAGQVLAWDATESKWTPTSINGSVTFNTAGTHQWAVPAWLRWVYVNAAAGNGGSGIGTNGEPGQVGQNAYFLEDGTPVAATTGANGANGASIAGTNGKSITVTALGLTYNGGAGGAGGLGGYGGGGSGGGGASDGTNIIPPANGANGNGPFGGYGAQGTGAGEGNGNGSAGQNGYRNYAGIGGSGGDAGVGGNGGNGGLSDSDGGGGGGGGGVNEDGTGSGGGGGAGGARSTVGSGVGAGSPGQGGLGVAGGSGGTGDTFAGAVDLAAVAGTTISVVISEGAGNASITFTY